MSTHITYTVKKTGTKFTAAEVVSFLSDIPAVAEIQINYNSAGGFLIAEYDHKMHVLVPGEGEEDR